MKATQMNATQGSAKKLNFFNPNVDRALEAIQFQQAATIDFSSFSLEGNSEAIISTHSAGITILKNKGPR